MQRKLGLDILGRTSRLVVGRKGVAVGAEGAGHIEDRGVVQRLLQTESDGVIVVLGLDDGDRNAEFLVKNVVGELLLLLVPARDITAHHDGAGGQRHLAADLGHRVPSRLLDARRNIEIADVGLAEIALAAGLAVAGHAPIPDPPDSPRHGGQPWGRSAESPHFRVKGRQLQLLGSLAIGDEEADPKIFLYSRHRMFYICSIWAKPTGTPALLDFIEAALCIAAVFVWWARAARGVTAKPKDPSLIARSPAHGSQRSRRRADRRR